MTVSPTISATSPPMAQTLTASMQALVTNVERVITGKRSIVELAVMTLASGGHLLLEDIPGVGKTMLARALARSIDGSFHRIQGAPDLLPADLTGSSVYDQGQHTFRFVAGPLFANVVLVDELNRTTPRTQAALLESMEEGQVTVDGAAHPLPQPHIVVATQNPVEQHGTFPLPESQLDRFTVSTSIGYPAEEAAMVRAQLLRHPLETLGPVQTSDQVLLMQQAVRNITVQDSIIDYAVRLTDATRRHPEIELGASPRASIQLVHTSQARAGLDGRSYALPDDVKALAPFVLPHRLMTRDGEAETARSLVVDLLRSVPVDA